MLAGDNKSFSEHFLISSNLLRRLTKINTTVSITRTRTIPFFKQLIYMLAIAIFPPTFFSFLSHQALFDSVPP